MTNENVIMKTHRNKKHLAKGFLLAALSIASADQTASAFQVSTLLDGNDCGTVFQTGSGFNSCYVVFDVTDGNTTNENLLSPIIAKTENGGGSWEINALYPTVDGSEFSLTDTDGTGTFFGTGDWLYNPLDDDDPAVKYWVAKASNNFNLFWDVPDAAVAVGGVCDVANKYTLACLSAAQAVTRGSWTTPLNNQGEPRNLSHISFYDTKRDGGGGGGQGGQAPEPNVLALFGMGLAVMGLSGIRRKRKAN